MPKKSEIFFATARQAFAGIGKAMADEVELTAETLALFGKPRPTEEELSAIYDDRVVAKLDRLFADAAAAVRASLRAEYDQRRAEIIKARPAEPPGS